MNFVPVVDETNINQETLDGLFMCSDYNVRVILMYRHFEFIRFIYFALTTVQSRIMTN